MAIFDEANLNQPDEWRTFQLFRYGPINLFHNPDILKETVDFLREKQYVVHEFDCGRYKSENDILWDVGLRLGFPYEPGWNPGLDGFNDFLRDIEVPQESGLVLAFTHFDRFYTDFKIYARHFLDIICHHYHQNLLFGRRFISLVQLDDGLFQIEPIGEFPAYWNQKEWLVSSRNP